MCDVLDPNFVSSFVYADKVYFFFREMAIENINCGKVSIIHRCLTCAKEWMSSKLNLLLGTTAENNKKELKVRNL